MGSDILLQNIRNTTKPTPTVPAVFGRTRSFYALETDHSACPVIGRSLHRSRNPQVLERKAYVLLTAASQTLLKQSYQLFGRTMASLQTLVCLQTCWRLDVVDNIPYHVAEDGL
jgi:hypothetical protein